MVAITYGAARPAPKSVKRAPRQNIIGRFFTAFMEARLQRAYREIARREYLKHGLRDR
jgi:hypothetical protein